MESLEDVDFDNAFNPYKQQQTGNAPLSKKYTDASGRYKKQTTSLVEISRSEKAIIKGYV